MPADVIVYCINLADSRERRDFMQAQLDRLSLPVQFIDAVSGKTVNVDAVERYDRAERRKIGFDLTPNEVACALSHIKALKTFLSSDYNYAVILEDDVRLADDFELVTLELLKLKLKWDNIRLELGEKNRRPIKIKSINSRYALVVPFNMTMGLRGVLYSRTGAAKALKSLDSFYLPADTHLGETYKNGLKTFALSPSIVWEEGMESTIGVRRMAGASQDRKMVKKLQVSARKFERSIGKRIYLIRAWLASKAE